MKRLIILTFSLLLLLQINARETYGQILKERNAQTPEDYPKGSIEGVDFSVTIIGSGTPQYNPDRSGPSALVQYKNLKFLVDMGNGTREQLERTGFTRRNSPDALLITHHHLDHNEEFIPMVHQKFMLPGNFLVAGPAPIKEMTDYVAKFYKEDLEYRTKNKGKIFDANNTNATVKVLKGENTFTWRDIKISTTEVPHSIYTLAYRFDVDGKSIVISGDLTYTPNLPKLALGADILVMDSHIIRKNANRNGQANSRKNTSKQGSSAHASIEDAAKMAMEANVKTLILTHLPNATIDEEATKAKIAEQFKGLVIIAKDLLTVSADGQIFMIEEVSTGNQRR